MSEAQDTIQAAEAGLFWQSRTDRNYRRMLLQHRPLWHYVKQYIRTHGIERVLEVGGGLRPPARRWVSQYQGIEPHEEADALHKDFLTLDVSPWRHVDLLLACGVIEHTGPSWVTFLHQVRQVAARHTMVGFFRPLTRRRTTWKCDARGFWLNSFAIRDIQRVLAAFDLNGRFELLGPRDTILVIEL